MTWLVCTAGDDKGLSAELAKDKPLVVGRDEHCDIRLVQQAVSRRHCEVRLKSGQLIVEDLDSYNGIKFGGKRIKGKTIKLDLNEYFEIGNDRFEYLESHDKYLEANQEVAKDLKKKNKQSVLDQYANEAVKIAAGKLDQRRRFAWWARLFGRKGG